MESSTIRLRVSSPSNLPKADSDVHFSPMASPTQRKRKSLLSWSELSPWQQDNEFIRSHYRPASYSYFGSMTSLCWLHNQSINIYTHLIGAIFFIASSYYFHSELGKRYKSESKTDIFVFDCFFLGAILCFGFSASFHTLANHSAEVYRSWLLFDMIGILCLTTGSFFPGVFYGFYCEPEVIRTYWSMVGSRRIFRLLQLSIV